MTRRSWWAGLFLVVGACAPTAQERRAHELADDGVFLYKQGAYPQARADFQAALKLRPDDPDLIYDIGRCWERQGQPDRARAAYTACLQKNPDHADCRHALAVLAYESGDRNGCRDMIEEWLRSSPRLATAYAEQGWLLRKEGNLPLARDRLLQALDLDPTDRRTLEELGVVHGLLGQPDLAAKIDERALTFYPDLPEVKTHLASMRRQLEEREKKTQADAPKP